MKMRLEALRTLSNLCAIYLLRRQLPWNHFTMLLNSNFRCSFPPTLTFPLRLAAGAELKNPSSRFLLKKGCQMSDVPSVTNAEGQRTVNGSFIQRESLYERFPATSK